MLLRPRERSSVVRPDLRFNLALDSGAFSLFTKHFVKSERRYKNGARATPSARSDPEAALKFRNSVVFRDYLDSYVAFLGTHARMFDFYVTVDVLDNVRLTKEIMAGMKVCGLKPMPVYHYGEPFSVFKEYARDHEYVALGGNSPSDAKALQRFASPVFQYICGKRLSHAPAVKIHALGMTSIPFMAHFPIYSFDSTSWAYQARTGAVLLPRIDHAGKFRWLDRWMNVPVTPRTTRARNHWQHISPAVQKHVFKYLAVYGFRVEQLAVSYTQRDMMNMVYWFGVQRELNAHYLQRWKYDGGHVYLSGNPTTGGDDPHIYNETLCEAARRAAVFDINYLATFWYKNDLKELMSIKRWWDVKLREVKR